MKIYELLHGLESSSLAMSPDVIELLREEKAGSYVMDKLRQAGVVLTWEEDASSGLIHVEFVPYFVHCLQSVIDKAKLVLLFFSCCCIMTSTSCR